MFKKILFVCVGNVCRSPMAACITQAHLNNTFTVTSAGVAALVGEPMDAVARDALKAHGYQDIEHKAIQLERALVQDADLILVMEKKLIDVVLRITPEARGKIFMLGKWQNDREIPDPYKQSRATFEHTFVLIHEAVISWINHLK